MHIATLQIHLSQTASVRTALMEVRAEQETEMAGRLCFTACQVRMHYPLATLFLISPLMCCEVMPACLQCTAKPQVRLKWHTGLAWHQENAEIRQVETRNEGHGSSTQKTTGLKTTNVFLSMTLSSDICP